jgi:hypothetical protein
MIFMSGTGVPFSPASAVEGRTTNSQLTNVPFFKTKVGYGETTHYHVDYNPGGIPYGIDSGVWTAGSNYYYWSMVGNQYMYDYIESSTYGDGAVFSPEYLEGIEEDGYYAWIVGEYYGDGGNIAGEMNTQYSGGEVYVYCTSYYTAESSDMYVFVSDDYDTWHQVGDVIHVGRYGPFWIDVGSYLEHFRYIAIAGYDTGYNVELMLDAVRVGSY